MDKCGGNESSISSCGHSGWGNHENCTHSQDASVTCSYDSLPVRLANMGRATVVLKCLTEGSREQFAMMHGV